MADEDDRENPFAPAVKPKSETPAPKKKKEKSEDEKTRSNEEQLLGIRKSDLTKEEESYITEQMEELMERLGKKAHLKPIISEVIRCDQQMTRVDKQIVECETQYATRLDKLIPKLKSLNAMHKSYMDRYVKACQTLGIMPKDMQPTDGDEALSDIHVRYKDALDKRRTKNHPIGVLSSEAKLLADQEGLRAEHYTVPGALSDHERDEVIETSDDVLPEDE